MKIKIVLLLMMHFIHIRGIDIAGLNYNLTQLKKDLADLKEALQKFQPNLRQEIEQILKTTLNFKNPNFASAEIPYSAFENFGIKLTQYVNEKGDTPLTADFNYKGARATLEYFNQKFLQPFFRAIRGKENNAPFVKQQLKDLAKKVADYTEVGGQITIGDVLEQLQEFIDSYKENRNRDDNESENRYQQLRNNIKELARYTMQTIIADFNQSAPYEYKGDGVTPLSQETVDTFKEALNVYKKVATKNDLTTFYPIFLEWFGRVQAWQGKKPGQIETRPENEQLLMLRVKIARDEQRFREGDLSEEDKKDLLETILEYHDLLEKTKKPEDFDINLLYHEICTNIKCIPSPKIKKRQEKVEIISTTAINKMTIEEMENTIEIARQDWITNKSSWSPQKKQQIIKLIEAYRKKHSLKPAFARFYAQLTGQ